jgi:hypothetical protein
MRLCIYVLRATCFVPVRLVLVSNIGCSRAPYELVGRVARVFGAGVLSPRWQHIERLAFLDAFAYLRTTCNVQRATCNVQRACVRATCNVRVSVNWHNV